MTAEKRNNHNYKLAAEKVFEYFSNGEKRNEWTRVRLYSMELIDMINQILEKKEGPLPLLVDFHSAVLFLSDKVMRYDDVDTIFRMDNDLFGNLLYLQILRSRFEFIKSMADRFLGVKEKNIAKGPRPNYKVSKGWYVRAKVSTDSYSEGSKNYFIGPYYHEKLAEKKASQLRQQFEKKVEEFPRAGMAKMEYSVMERFHFEKTNNPEIKKKVLLF